MKRNLFFFCLSLLITLGFGFQSYSQCDPGIMSPGPVFICDGESGSSLADDLVLDGDCSLGYLLLDNSSGDFTDLIEYNATGVFRRDTLLDVDEVPLYDETYYIHSVVGPDDDGDGLPDLNHADVIISGNLTGGDRSFTEVVFLTDIQITAVQVCDENTGMSEVTVTVTGGFPGFDPSEFKVEVEGAIEGQTDGGVFIFDLPANSEVFEIVCSDSKFCTSTLEFFPEPCLFDLALTKVLADGQAATVMPGDDVTFTIEVFNQGSFSVMGINIVDYIPSGFVLNDADWTAVGNTATTEIAGPLATGASTTVDITLTVVPGTDAGSYMNFAEIENFEDLAGNPADDLDSTPDNDPNNDGTPIDNVTDGSMGDEDDHDFATVAVNVPVFDLALMKTLAAGQSSTIQPGDNVTFTITVYNQGEASAQNIVVADYIPAGLTLNDAAWTQMGTTATTTIAGPIAPGASSSVNITFSVPNTAGSSTETNFSEIASADDMFGNPGVDADSTPDMNNSNDGTPVDDELNNAGGDEDDHDLATIEIVDPVFDLALTKVLDSAGPFEPGDAISFTITVYNQGQEAAQNIVITDYIPAGLTLTDGNWSLAADGASATTTIAGPVAAGAQASVSISFTINPDVQSGSYTNLAEISSAQDPFGNTATDIDSTADNDPNNDGSCVDNAINNENGDEDDHDCATFEVEACTSTATMPTNAIWVCAENTGLNGSGTATLDLNPGHVVCYILHDSPTDQLGTVYDQNSSGLFSQPASLPDNSALYISAIVGPPGASGCPDVDSACQISAGTEIIFLAPIVVDVTLECTDDGYTATINITGGTPQFNNAQVYTVSGSGTGQHTYNVPVVYGPFADGTPFSLNVTDSKNCVASYSSDAPECGCRNEPGVMSQVPLIACAGAQLSSVQTGSVLAPGDVGVYALHTSGTDQAGTIIAVNATGSFADSGNSCDQLYISYVFGPDDGTGAPDLTSDCLIVLPGTPALWVPPISIEGEEVCDNSVGEFSVNYTISGGYPACDASATYSVTGDNLLSGVGAGTYPISGVFSDGDSYMVTVVDQNGCSDTFDSGPVQCIKLPISLITLDGSALEEGNLIKWITGSEIENDYFTLYRSIENGQFVEIGTVKGNGTKNTTSNYKLLDRNAPAGMSTYKLEQTDNDGTVNFVGVVDVQRSESTALNINSILPIPVISNLQVNYQAVAGITEIKIYDMVGRSIQDLQIESINGLNFYNLNLNGLTSGVYFITLLNDNKVATKRFVKQ